MLNMNVICLIFANNFDKYSKLRPCKWHGLFFLIVFVWQITQNEWATPMMMDVMMLLMKHPFHWNCLCPYRLAFYFWTAFGQFQRYKFMRCFAVVLISSILLRAVSVISSSDLDVWCILLLAVSVISSSDFLVWCKISSVPLLTASVKPLTWNTTNRVD